MPYFIKNYKQQLKNLSPLLDTIGIMYLSVFLATTLNLGFLIDAIPNCHMYDAIITMAKCNGDILGAISETILNFGSPLIFALLILIVPAIFSNFFLGNILTSIGYSIGLIILFFVLFSALRVVLRGLAKFINFNFGKTQREQITSLAVLILIALPTLVISLYRILIHIN